MLDINKEDWPPGSQPGGGLVGARNPGLRDAGRLPTIL